MLVISIFLLFFGNVFKRLPPRACQHSGLFGKGLNPHPVHISQTMAQSKLRVSEFPDKETLIDKTFLDTNRWYKVLVFIKLSFLIIYFVKHMYMYIT